MCTDRLRVEIAPPHEPPNDTCRFDRAGFVTEVVLDGIHRFAASEPNNLATPCTGGRGLCSEYRFDDNDCIPAGERFLKLGVGILVQPDNRPYSHLNLYHVAVPCEVEASQTSMASVVFTTAPIACRGYAVRQTKTLTVAGNRLTIKTELENVGERPLLGTEYNHNFVTIDGMALGPDYTLTASRINVDLYQSEDSVLAGSNGALRFSRFSPKAGVIRIQREQLLHGDVACWCVENRAAGARILGQDHIRLCAANIWYADHMISPEWFHRVDLLPGKRDSWQRTWTFESF